MSKSRPVVVHPDEGMAGPATPGMERRQLFDCDGREPEHVSVDGPDAAGG